MVVVHLPGASLAVFTDRGGPWLQRKGWYGTCGVLKNGFPRRITLPRRLSLRPNPLPTLLSHSLSLSLSLSLFLFPRRFIGRVYTGPGWIFFGKNFRDVSVSEKNDRSAAADNSLVRPRQNKGSCHGYGPRPRKKPNASLDFSRATRSSCVRHRGPGFRANHRGRLEVSRPRAKLYSRSPGRALNFTRDPAAMAKTRRRTRCPAQRSEESRIALTIRQSGKFLCISE